MLDLISSETSIKDFYNCEIVPETYRIQVNRDTNLIGSSVLNLPFKNDSFDCMIIKNLLHHLVAKTRKESKENVKRATMELIRVVKDTGHIIVLEQYNKYSFLASIVFHLTLFVSLFGIGFKSLGWGNNIIVSFLTPDEIKTLIEKQDKAEVEIVLNISSRSDVPKKYKFTILMSNIGRILLIGRVRKHK